MGAHLLNVSNNLQPHHRNLKQSGDEEISVIHLAEFTPNNKKCRPNLPISVSNPHNKKELDIQKITGPNPTTGNDRLDHIPRYVTPFTITFSRRSGTLIVFNRVGFQAVVSRVVWQKVGTSSSRSCWGSRGRLVQRGCSHPCSTTKRCQVESTKSNKKSLRGSRPKMFLAHCGILKEQHAYHETLQQQSEYEREAFAATQARTVIDFALLTFTLWIDKLGQLECWCFRKGIHKTNHYWLQSIRDNTKHSNSQQSTLTVDTFCSFLKLFNIISFITRCDNLNRKGDLYYAQSPLPCVCSGCHCDQYYWSHQIGDCIDFNHGKGERPGGFLYWSVTVRRPWFPKARVTLLVQKLANVNSYNCLSKILKKASIDGWLPMARNPARIDLLGWVKPVGIEITISYHHERFLL